MENKEVEKATTRLYRPYSSSIELQKLYKEYNGEEFSIDDDIYLINKYVEQLEEENDMLKQLLQAKDKALDKACEELTKYNTYEFDDFQTKEDWKEWCENE